MIKIHCKYDKLVDIDGIVPHPDNENKHTKDQIRVLSKIIKKDGVRHPIIISKLSGYICVGHGRLEAFRLLGMKEAPIDFQDFEDPIQELRVRNADNNIARYSEFDRDKFEINLGELDLKLEDLDLEEFGKIDLEFKSDLGDDFEDIKIENTKDKKLCPHCGLEL